LSKTITKVCTNIRIIGVCAAKNRKKCANKMFEALGSESQKKQILENQSPIWLVLIFADACFPMKGHQFSSSARGFLSIIFAKKP
jgi:hypothetical protein